MNRQFSIRRMFLFVALIAAALGSFRACFEIDSPLCVAFGLLGFLFCVSAGAVNGKQPAISFFYIIDFLCLLAMVLLALMVVLIEIVPIQ